ncbi:MAG: NAD(P)-dependent glycerol-3-phosphate dehydrogenase [Clostridia bacterium]|nr:NAD(P)-dependent glycerol-3-phosphate dehydrogenase [Clostridia bacterium]
MYLAHNGNEIKIWSFDEEECRIINEEKKCKFLKDVSIPDGVTAYTDFKTVIEDSEIILHVTPSKFFRNTLNGYKEFVNGQPIIICSKGFEADSLMTLDDIIKEEMPGVKFGVLSGPSHAEEVSIDMPTAMVVASEDDELNNRLANILKSDTMRIYTSNDVKGVELGGGLKNIIAFCAGVLKGLGLGDNSFAALITRGLTEISRIGVVLGGKKDTFYGLTGLGDLIVTCASEHSRNRRAGILIGQGNTIEETREKVGMTIESIDNIEVAYKLAKKYDVDVPIINTVYNVLYNKLNPKDGVIQLMRRDLKQE